MIYYRYTVLHGGGATIQLYNALSEIERSRYVYIDFLIWQIIRNNIVLENTSRLIEELIELTHVCDFLHKSTQNTKHKTQNQT